MKIGDKERGGDRKSVTEENEIRTLSVCPPFFGGRIISGLNNMPEKGKEEEG